jgi:hypothetical protein
MKLDLFERKKMAGCNIIWHFSFFSSEIFTKQYNVQGMHYSAGIELHSFHTLLPHKHSGQSERFMKGND